MNQLTIYISVSSAIFVALMFIKPVLNPTKRLVITALMYCMFWVVSSLVYSSYINREAAGYWAMGLWGVPIILLVIWYADKGLRKLQYIDDRPRLILALDSILSIALYIPSIIFVYLVFVGLSIVVEKIF
ncbi:hypothetical protein ACMXYV_07685 [Neptuniibacter sp. SY11_33]|uniref:hypothetical protein n=1 Tax=Neptuniibacter sp. SY11_33 TaxID=3398215 RepID=UPI0039F4609C